MPVILAGILEFEMTTATAVSPALPINLIVQYKEAELADDMADGRRSDAWQEMVGISKKFASEDNWMGALRAQEDDYMETMYADVPEAKKGDGTWKYRKFTFADVNEQGEKEYGGLPAGYSSAKSTIKQAREAGVRLVEKGMAVPKTVVGKGVAAHKANPATPFQQALNHLKRLRVSMESLDSNEKAAIREELSTI